MFCPQVPQENDQNSAAGVDSDHSSLDEIDDNDIDSDDEKFRIDTEEVRCTFILKHWLILLSYES